MISFGIGYGQIDDFKKFIKDSCNIEWKDMTIDQKTSISHEFLSPKNNKESDVPSKICIPEKSVKKEKEVKSDIMSFYRDTVRKSFDPTTLLETSMSRAFLTAINKNGWILEVVLKDKTKTVFPFVSEENMSIIVDAIWRDVDKYAKDNNLI